MAPQTSGPSGLSVARHTLGPLLLLSLCPPAALLLWHTHTALGGSLAALVDAMSAAGPAHYLWSVWRPVLLGSPTAWAIIIAFAAFEIALLRGLPGAVAFGPETPNGHIPRYTANGVAAFVITLATFCALSFGLGVFPASIIYDHFGEILGALNLGSLVFCLLLYAKGRIAPSGPDAGHTGHFIFDYYWGTELYPRIGGVDVKQLTNCRFGMMSWPLVLLSFAAAQADRHGAVSDSMLVAVAIQLVYVAKFFVWETGYLRSLDIMHDRAGFYICWGCLVWVPCVYTSSTLYLVDHPRQLGTPLALACAALGIAAVMINYAADRERQRVRATGGACTVWGKPPRLLRARYRTESGEERESLLLASGFWGLSRHFHYVPEILGAFFWTLPVGFSHALPWFYVVFLTILLADRANRDEARCRAKYGATWDAYCALVPNRIVPRYRTAPVPSPVNAAETVRRPPSQAA